MKYKTYLFDFDYTLANSERGILLCFQYVLKNNGYHDITDEAIKKTIGLTLEDEFTIFTGITDKDELARLKKEYVAKADQEMVANTKLYPEVLPMIDKIKQSNAKIGIISTKYRYRIMKTLEQYEIQESVDLVVGGEDVSVAKPDPQGILKAVDELGQNKRDVLYIGDSLVDANTAKNAGIDFLGVTTGTTTKEDFKDLPHVLIVDNLSKLI